MNACVTSWKSRRAKLCVTRRWRVARLAHAGHAHAWAVQYRRLTAFCRAHRNDAAAQGVQQVRLCQCKVAAERSGKRCQSCGRTQPYLQTPPDPPQGACMHGGNTTGRCGWLAVHCAACACASQGRALHGSPLPRRRLGTPASRVSRMLGCNECMPREAGVPNRHNSARAEASDWA